MADRQEMSANLARMDELDDFDIADREPDPRGWEIRSADDREIGEVDELIVDTQAMKVRYLDCALNEDELGLEEQGRHILIPVGFARLDEDDETVQVDRLTTDEVARLPEFTGLPIQREEEEELETAFAGGAAPPEPERPAPRREEGERPEGIRVTRAEEEMTVGKREREAGEVDVEKTVETEHVRQPVTRRHEEVEVERRPVEGARAAPGEGEFEEEEVRVPLHEEEIEVQKRPEVKEEVVVRKRPVEEEEEVEADVRRERIDVEEHGEIEEEGHRRGRRR